MRIGGAMEQGTSRKAHDKRGKWHRTEVITLRLTPQLRFLVELATLAKGQTVSRFVEEAVTKALREVQLRESGVTLEQIAVAVWDPLEPDRFVKLALRYPEFLNFEQQVLWKLIVECDALWSLDAQQRRNIGPEAGTACDFPLLRAHWDAFKQAARDVDPESLPPSLYPRRGIEDVSTPPQAQPRPRVVRRAAEPE
jgi:hypothetical protein